MYMPPEQHVYKNVFANTHKVNILTLKIVS